jgi:DNA polymerase (family 10)
LSAENALLANAAAVKIATSTDAHSTREFGTIRYGVDQARRAALEKAAVLNCLSWITLAGVFR